MSPHCHSLQPFPSAFSVKSDYAYVSDSSVPVCLIRAICSGCVTPQLLSSVTIHRDLVLERVARGKAGEGENVEKESSLHPLIVPLYVPADFITQAS